MKMNKIQKKLMAEVADLHSIPIGAYNFRINGDLAGRTITTNINIQNREEGDGINVYIRDNTKNESVHIPVILSNSGYKEKVYNDFYIGENCDVLIVAGCGIDNCGNQDSQHDGIHRFFIGKNSKIRYVEKHYGSGRGLGRKFFNPETVVHLAENSIAKMEMIQLEGVDRTNRITRADLQRNAKLIVHECLLTSAEQRANSIYEVILNGDNSSAEVISRSVAKEKSYQKFEARIVGNTRCRGHIECDSIIMDKGKILAIPSLEANDIDAELIHEAAIGKIATEQIIKLMSLGLTESEAVETIICGFLQNIHD